MFSIKRRTILKTFIILLLIFTVFVGLLCILVSRPSFQNYLLAQLGETTGYILSARQISLNLRHGLGFNAYDLQAESQKQPIRFRTSWLSVSLDTKELIKCRIVPTTVLISQPRIKLALETSEKTMKAGDGFIMPQMVVKDLSKLRSFSVMQGHISIKGCPFEIQQFDVEVHPEKGEHLNLTVKFLGNAVSAKHKVPFSLKGNIFADGKPGDNLLGEMSWKTDKFPITWIPCPSGLPFSRGTGKIDIELKYARGRPVSAEGTILAEDVRFAVIKMGRKKDYSFRFLKIDLTALYSGKILEISSFKLKGPYFNVSADAKFNFSDKSNPYIYFCAKSPVMPLQTLKRIFPTPLIPSWIEEQLFPILSNGNTRVDHFSMKGTRSQYQNMNLPENSDVLSMKVEWKDLVVFNKHDALPFEKVTGDLSIEKSALSTTVTSAIFGNSTITRATLDVDSIYETTTNSIVVDGQFDLNDLMQQEKLCPMPADIRKIIQAFKTVKGDLKGQMQLDFNGEWASPKIIMGNFLGRNCFFVHKNLFLPVSLDEAVLINKEGENSFHGTGHWGKSGIQGTGSAGRQWENCKIQITSQVHIPEIINYFFPEQPYLNCPNLVPLQATLARKNKVWSCQGKIDPDQVAFETGPVSIYPPGKDDEVIFDLDVYPDNKWYLKNMRCTLGKSYIQLAGVWDLKNRDRIKLNVLTEELDLKDLGLRFNKQAKPAEGIIFCNVEMQDFVRSSAGTSVTGKAAGRDISFAMAKFPSQINEGQFDLIFSGKNVSVNSFNVLVGQSPVSILGALKGWEGLKGRLAIEFNHFDFADFIDTESDNADEKTPQSPFTKKCRIQFDLNAHKGKWKRLNYESLEAECILRSGDFYIKNAEARMEHGIITLNGHIKGSDGPKKLFFSSEVLLKKQPVGDFLYSLGLEKEIIAGPMNLTGKLSAKGKNTKDLLAGLQSNTHFQVRKGKIIGSYGLTIKILNVLNLQNVFHGRLPNLSKESFPFDSIEGHINCKDGILETDDFTLKSPILNAVAPGTINLPQQKLDMIVWVQSLETMDNVISKIPIVGYILTEKENAPKGVFIYPIEVTGPISDPNVKYSPSLIKFGAGIINIFKRILYTPSHIFSTISNGIKKRNKKNEPLSDTDTGKEHVGTKEENESLDKKY